MPSNELERRQFLARSAAGLTAAAMASDAEFRAEERSRPNILWLLGDQHRAQALSCMGDPNLSTPHIDRLAGGVGVTAVAGCPLCTPFRGSLRCLRSRSWESR